MSAVIPTPKQWAAEADRWYKNLVSATQRNLQQILRPKFCDRKEQKNSDGALMESVGLCTILSVCAA